MFLLGRTTTVLSSVCLMSNTIRAVWVSSLLQMFFLAATPRVSAELLTVDQAVGVALANNGEVKIARLVVERARSRLTYAGRMPNPDLGLGRTTDLPFDDRGDYDLGIEFRQRFPISGRLARASEVARIEVDQALAEIRNVERIVVAEVVRAVRNLQVLDERRKVNADLHSSLKKLIAISEKKLGAAELSAADVNHSRLELAKLKLREVAIDEERAGLVAEICDRLGRTSATCDISVEPPSFAVRLPPLEQASADALKRRPDRTLKYLDVERADSEIRLAQAERWDDWEVGVSYDQERRYSDGMPERDEYVGLNLSVPLPLWNNNREAVVLAEVGGSQARLTLQLLERKILNEVSAAYLQLKRVLPAFEAFNSESVKLAHDNVRLINSSHEQGLVGVSVVIQSEQQLADVRQGSLDLGLAVLRALTEFETATASGVYAGREGDEL